MTNEIRNELLTIMYMAKEGVKKENETRLDYLLERFEYDLERQLKDKQNEIIEIQNNIDLLAYVRKELNIK